MYLKELHITGFKSFGKPTKLLFSHPIVGIVGPNGSGKSNIAEAFRFVLGEQSMKSLRGKRGEDLIFNGAGKSSRSNRAAVSIVFDNRGHLVSDAFDEITVSRTVYRDGTGEYRINDTPVRHQDVVDLLARANLGTTNHHIISQGQADQVLSASPEMRKEILEDGLGLRVLQHRRSETEKKLKKALANITKTEAVIHELTPRLAYLKRQVGKREKARVLREELAQRYTEYLSRETAYLTTEEVRLNEALEVYREEQKETETAIAKERKSSSNAETAHQRYREKENQLRGKLEAVRKKKHATIRAIGRCEGQLESATSTDTTTTTTILREDVTTLYQTINARCEGTRVNYASVVSFILRELKTLLQRKCHSVDDAQKQYTQLLHEQKELQECLAQLEEQEATHLFSLKKLLEEKECTAQSDRDTEKALFVLRSRNHEVRQKLSETVHALENLKEDRRRFQEELKEGKVLVGDAITAYKEKEVEMATKEGRREQETRRRDIERKKIRLEELGTGLDTSVYKEYEETEERVTFLTGERKDLLNSIRDCEEGVAVIQKEIDSRFKRGVTLVNKEFNRFFNILFDGGKAGIAIEKRVIDHDEGEDSEVRLGIAVRVSLPHKRITSLNQLSGGERTLVSIALLFAISQITPPPFLVLDETDAALDEANSRRYGSMIASLARKAQLVIITHNRETMQRAGVLYGVTMGATGSSTLLSVQFDEALQQVAQ